MPYRIREGLSYCLCEGHPVFLDIGLGRYFTLPSHLCAPFAAVVADEDAGVDARDIARLLTLRVIETGAPRAMSAMPLRMPSSEVTALRPRGRTIRAAVAQGFASHRVHHIALRKLLTIEAARRPSDRIAEDGELGRLRGAFDRVAIMFGEADRCLPRSLAFRRLALREGHSPALVIGVKIDPFAAHCWVQSGTRIDNDSVERVRLFTPIYSL